MIHLSFLQRNRFTFYNVWRKNMFSAYSREVTYTDRLFGFYFYKDHGAIIHTSLSASGVQENFFKQLQNNVNVALHPLLKLIDQAGRKELDNYAKTGGLFSRMPVNHPGSILLNLSSMLQTNPKFFGKYQDPLPINAIPNNNPVNLIEVWAEALANLTHVDKKEAYKLLLKINACKKQYYFVDSGCSDLPKDDRFFVRNKESEDDYKHGIQEIISFADFQKKIEKSIAYLVSKANQDNVYQNQIQN
jgi:hypothetical protein